MLPAYGGDIVSYSVNTGLDFDFDSVQLCQENAVALNQDQRHTNEKAYNWKPHEQWLGQKKLGEWVVYDFWILSRVKTYQKWHWLNETVEQPGFYRRAVE